MVPGSGVANHLAMALEEQYIKDPVEKDQLFDAIHTMPAVRDKARWGWEEYGSPMKSVWLRVALNN